MTTSPDAPSIRLVAQADTASLAGVDMVIDARSPAEFAEDRVPGAVNLPVLSDVERVEVGTLYVASRFEARRLGAALVARNIARHLEGALADKPDDFRPLVYCWRGGQRSHAFATVLSQVGWRTSLLQGGYRTYRRMVQDRLYGHAPSPRFVLIDGNTGTGKTAVLQRLAARGLQVLDLEGLAEHRGSLLGGYADRPQPGQKLFESRLTEALDRLDLNRTIVAEAESSKIGERMIPPLVWRGMQTAPRIELVAEPADRARFLVSAYSDVIADPAGLAVLVQRLPTHPSRERLATWEAMIGAGDFEALATALMALHYDPAYARSSKKETRTRLGEVAVRPQDEASLDAAADAVADLVRRA
jgi:tRNA 2-selenouridine synthase